MEIFFVCKIRRKYVFFRLIKNVQFGTKVPVHRSLNKDIISTCFISLFYYDRLALKKRTPIK